MSHLVRYPGAGCIVEYMEGNAPQIALVTEEQSGKLRLLLPNRRETRLGANRLLPWSGPVVQFSGRDAAVQILEAHRLKREELAHAIDTMEVWEMAQGEVDKASAEWFAELGSDAPDVDSIAAYGRVLMQCKSHFKFHPPHFEVFSGEIVEARLSEQEAVKQREALVVGGATFFRLLWEVHCKKRTLPLADSAEWPSADISEHLKDMLLQRVADPESVEDDILWRTVVKGLPDLQHLPLHLAQAWELLPAHHNFWLDRADYAPGDQWATEFLSDVVAVMEAAQSENIPFLDWPFLSIDSSTTRDVDDAFYIENLSDGSMRLHVALACPALCWPFDSALDKAVSRRATSIYLPEATHHMLPESLGTDAFSLVAGQVRPALCLACDVATDGEIIHCAPQVCRVRLAANLCFEDSETFLQGGSVASLANYEEQLKLGETLALARQKLRIAAGAVIMDRPDPKITLEGEGIHCKVKLEDSVQTPRSQMLVAEMMVLASAAIAQWGQERSIALLYRTQDVAIPREYAGVWTAPHDMARIIRALAPSSLELTPRPHAGLAVPSYSPVTSPLRRYPDLINESQVVSWLLTGKARFDLSELESLLVSLNVRLDAAGQIQRFRPRYWKLLYVWQQGDRFWWDGVITEENDTFCSVSLPREQLFVRGRRHMFGERACPGQPVQVRLGKVNPLYNEMTLLEVIDV